MRLRATGLLLYAYPLIVPHLRRARRERALPSFNRWHATTQNRLFAHLRAIWPLDGRPKYMVDLGCHAGHGAYRNVSDALIWLHYFNESGAVMGVDAFEDYALDLQATEPQGPRAARHPL